MPEAALAGYFAARGWLWGWTSSKPWVLLSPQSKSDSSTREHNFPTAWRPPSLSTWSTTSLKHKTKKNRTRDTASRLWYRGSAGTPAAHSTAAHPTSGCLNTSCQSQSSKPGGALTPLISYLYFQRIFCHGKGFCAAAIHMDTRNHLWGRRYCGTLILQLQLISCSCNNIAINASLAEQLIVLYFRWTPGRRFARRTGPLQSLPKSKRPESKTTTQLSKHLLLTERRQQVRC